MLVGPRSEGYPFLKIFPASFPFGLLYFNKIFFDIDEQIFDVIEAVSKHRGDR